MLEVQNQGAVITWLKTQNRTAIPWHLSTKCFRSLSPHGSIASFLVSYVVPKKKAKEERRVQLPKSQPLWSFHKESRRRKAAFGTNPL